MSELRTIDMIFREEAVAVAWRMVSVCILQLNSEPLIREQFLYTCRDFIGDEANSQQTIGFAKNPSANAEPQATCIMHCENGKWVAGVIEIRKGKTVSRFHCGINKDTEQLVIIRHY